MKETGGVLTVGSQLGQGGQLLISVRPRSGIAGRKSGPDFRRLLCYQNLKSAAWGCRSAVPSRSTVAACGPEPTMECLMSICHPEPRNWKYPLPKRDI